MPCIEPHDSTKIYIQMNSYGIRFTMKTYLQRNYDVLADEMIDISFIEIVQTFTVDGILRIYPSYTLIKIIYNNTYIWVLTQQKLIKKINLLYANCWLWQVIKESANSLFVNSEYGVKMQFVLRDDDRVLGCTTMLCKLDAEKTVNILLW